MHRLLLIAFVAGALTVVPVGSVLAGAEAGRIPLASVKLEECSPSSALAVFHGRMRSVAGTEQMWMRFGLLEKVRGGQFRLVRSPALGRWRKSRLGVRLFGFRQRVLGLSKGAVYRARVDYRWYDPNGELIRRASRRSPPCRQPGGLPNLRVVDLGLAPERGLTPGSALYRVSVANAGRAAASGVDVALSVDGTVVNMATVSRLAPGEVQSVRLSGPGCARPEGTVEAYVDPNDAIPESSELDNGRSASCSSLRP